LTFITRGYYTIIHNDYTTELVPKFEIFSDRLEMTSAGAIHPGEERDVFFAGYSIPRNKTLMRVFKDLDMVEYLGSGMPRILRAYPRDAYTFSSHFIRAAFPMSPEALALESEVAQIQPLTPGTTGVESGVESPMALKVLHLLNLQEQGKQSLAENFDKERPWRYLNDLVARLVRDELIAMTIPDKPNSRLQKYRLTAKGHDRLRHLDRGK
jgi:ATP-dependent DNA helicase RecG